MRSNGKPVGAAGGWLMLYRGLLWRSRHEGLAPLAFPVGLFAAIAALSTIPGELASMDSVNSAAALAGYDDRLAAVTDVSQLRLSLLLAPGTAAIVLTLGGALTARTLVGTETGRGSLEALLAAGYTAQTLANAILAFTCTTVAGLWLAIEVLVGVWLGAGTAFYGASLSLSPMYVGILLLVPLLAGLVGAALAVILSLLWPKLAQQGGVGIGSNGNITSVVAMLPAVGALLVPLLTQSSTNTTVAGLLAACAIGGVVLAGLTTTLVTIGFRPTDVLES